MHKPSVCQPRNPKIMARFGSGINPALGAVDYSGFRQGALQGANSAIQGAQMQAQGISQGLSTLGQVVGDVGKQRLEFKTQVKAAEAAAKAVETIPDIDPKIIAFVKQQAEMMKDPNLSLRDQAAIGQGMNQLFGSVVQSGIQSIMRVQENNRIASELEGAGFDPRIIASVRAGGVGAAPGLAGAQADFTPKPGPQGRVMSMEQVAALKQQGFDVKAAPQEDGSFFVSEVSPFAPTASQTVNVDSSGNTIGAPPAGMAWARNPNDNSVAMRPVPGTDYYQPVAVPIGGSETESKMSDAAAAREGISASVAQMTDAIGSLAEMGALPDPTKPVAENISARIRGSKAGQVVAGALGTEEQSLRNTFNTNKPALINSIRQATGQSARAMDSERELEFYLKQIGEENADAVSTLAALYTIETRFNPGGNSVLSRIKDEALRVRVLERVGGLIEQGMKANSVKEGKKSGPRIISVEPIK